MRQFTQGIANFSMQSSQQLTNQVIPANFTSQSLQQNNKTIMKLINQPQQKPKKEYSLSSIRSKKKLSIKQLDRSVQQSSHEVIPQVKTLQPKNIQVYSTSARQNPDKLKHSYETEMIKKNTMFPNQNDFDRKDTYIRPNTVFQLQKKYQMSSQTIRHKLPLAILDFISKKAKLQAMSLKQFKETQTGKKLGKWGLSKKLQEKYNKKKCNICELQLPEKQFQKMSKSCQHTYCSSCLHQYVIYKIQSFQPVQCPNQGCHQPLDQQSKLYTQLPLQVRKKYKKLLQYQMIKTHTNRKMCPTQNCQGWIEINEMIEPICSVCKKVYCPKCLLQTHQGDCDNRQLEFFQDTLHYRQCSKCKNVIEKSAGCVHMTCRCGYQFCYLCGVKWNYSHTCTNPDQEPVPREMMDCFCCEVEVCQCNCEDGCDRCCDGNCCDCDCCDGCDLMERFGCEDCCDCSCCPDNHGQCDWIGDVCRIIFRFFLLILWIGVIFPCIIAFILTLGGFWIGVCFATGFTMYTFEIISDVEGCVFIAAIIFFPITGFVGTFFAFRELLAEAFIPQVSQMVDDAWESFKQNICGQQ